MRVVLALLLVAGAVALRPAEPTGVTLTCQKYGCGNWTNSGVCLQTNSTNVSILPCANPLVCNTTSGLCAAHAIPVVKPGWPGEPCSSSGTCAFGTCNTQSKCQGADVGGPCTQSDQCDPGLMCNNTGYCAPLMPAGTLGCRSTYDCDYFSVCNKTFSQTNGTCISSGVVQLGQTVADCNNSFSLLCETNTCIPTNITQLLGRCSVALSSVYNMPIGCNQNSDCVGSDGTSYYVGTCQCGMNALGLAFCSPFWGDIPGLTLRDTMTLVYGHSDRCNTVRRYTNACFNVTGNLNKMKVAAFGFYNYALLQENDQCIKTVFTATYWLGAGFVVQLGALLAVLSYI